VIAKGELAAEACTDAYFKMQMENLSLQMAVQN
jgi:hypothetical protein